MMHLQDLLLVNLYVEERLARAERERLLNDAARARHTLRERAALKARVGRTLVRVGQRLETTA